MTLAGQLQSSRMVTLIGASGVGKTRLAVQTGARVYESMPHGVWIIDFPLLPEPTLVIPAIAAALNIGEDPGCSLQDSILSALADKQMLLIFDNCELVRKACATAIDAIITNCPGVRILASGGAGFGVQGETVFAVKPLTLPGQEVAATPYTVRASEAGELYNECASVCNPDFTLSHANANAVTRLISAAAGMPSALLLLAHNVGELDGEHAARQLEASISSSSYSAASSHSAIVQSVIAWCYGRLELAAQDTLCRLSVLAGPWTSAAMQAITLESSRPDKGELANAASLLKNLESHGFVTMKQHSGVNRYKLPDPIREFCYEKLNAADRAQARRRYAEYYLRMAEEAGSDLEGTDAARMALWLEKEYPNLCAALAWCQEDPQQAQTGMKLASSLQRFWEVRGYPGEGQAMLIGASVWGNFSERTSLRSDALKRAGDTAYQSGNYTLAKSRHEEALAINRELGDKARQAINLNNLGNIARTVGDHAEAQTLHEQALDLNRTVGDQRREAINLHNLGNAFRDQGALDKAGERYVEAIAINLKLGDRVGIGHNLNSLARLAYSRGDRAEALRLYEEALTHFRAAGSQEWVAHNLSEIVKLNLRTAPIWTHTAASA